MIRDSNSLSIYSLEYPYALHTLIIRRRQLAFARGLSICLSESQGFSSKVIPKSLSQSLLLISGKTDDSAFLVLPWMVISYVFDRFNDIQLLSAQSLRHFSNYRTFIDSNIRTHDLCDVGAMPAPKLSSYRCDDHFSYLSITRTSNIHSFHWIL